MKIAYNAGHILATPGKRLPKELDANETREWVLNDRVARYFAAEIERYEGVELRRMDDPAGIENIDIDVRVARANEWGADFYLSIHHNAAGRIFAGGGYTVHIDQPGGMSETYAHAIYTAMLAANSDMRGDRADPMVSGDEQRLYECSATQMPAVLVECGYMDSAHDAPIILTEAHAKSAGAAIAQAVAQVAGLKRKEGFGDVPEGRYYTEPVAWAVKARVVKGLDEYTFGPEDLCTRGQAVTFLWRLAGCPEAEGELPFADVKTGSYCYDAVRWAHRQGIVDGLNDTIFGPNEPCTRGQFVTMLYRSVGCPAPDDGVEAAPFGDVDPDRFYYDAVLWAVREAITMGTTPTAFEPDKPINRAQAVTMLCRFAI